MHARNVTEYETTEQYFQEIGQKQTLGTAKDPYIDRKSCVDRLAEVRLVKRMLRVLFHASYNVLETSSLILFDLVQG